MEEKIRYVTYKKRPGFLKRHAGKIAATAIGAGLGAGYVGSMPHDVIKRGRDYAIGAGIGAIGGLGVHKMFETTDEAFANLTESNKVCMDKKDFKKEHVTLLRKLKRGNKRELRDEAQKQGKEMKKELHEALSEEKRASLPKSAFVSKTKKREGHRDKGMYPIFDAKSARSACKLAFHHPEMKQSIYRRAAKYGVGPLAESEDRIRHKIGKLALQDSLRNRSSYKILGESTDECYATLIEGRFFDAVKKLYTGISSKPAISRVADSAKHLASDVAANTMRLKGLGVQQAGATLGIPGIGSKHVANKLFGLHNEKTAADFGRKIGAVGKEMGMRGKYVMVPHHLAMKTGISPTIANITQSTLPRAAKAVIADSPKIKRFASDAGNLMHKGLSRVIGNKKASRLSKYAHEIAGKMGEHYFAPSYQHNAFYAGKRVSSMKEKVIDAAKNVVMHGPKQGIINTAGGVGVEHFDKGTLKPIANDKIANFSLRKEARRVKRPDLYPKNLKSDRKIARKLLAGRHGIYMTDQTNKNVGMAAHELGHAANAEFQHGAASHARELANHFIHPGVGTVGEEGLASLRAKKAMRRALGPREARRQGKSLQTAYHSYLSSIGESTEQAFANLIELDLPLLNPREKHDSINAIRMYGGEVPRQIMDKTSASKLFPKSGAMRSKIRRITGSPVFRSTTEGTMKGVGRLRKLLRQSNTDGCFANLFD